MSTPLSTPIRQAKLGISSTKSLPLANEYKKLLSEQYQRLWLKHQQDLDLIDDLRSYVKSRLSIEREYTQALSKLSKQHSAHINKRFTLLQQCDSNNNLNNPAQQQDPPGASAADLQQTANQRAAQVMLSESEASDSRLQKRLANNGLDEPDRACTLYKVWSEHINRLQSSTKSRAEQFEQLTMIVDKLKDIRSHKANIGKKCLDSHLKRVHEDVLVSMVELEKARKLYYEDESQAKKARENEEKFKKKRSGLLTKFTGGDLQARKEKTSAQREANDIQSTQARNDYIMALAAANAHLQHYYVKDLADFMGLIDDGVLDHCKIFMATLSECDINSLKEALHHAQYWSKMINLTGSQKTNSIFFDCDQSQCLRQQNQGLVFEPCNSDPISSISLEHNADYALQHEIDKWFTWFKKECRNLSQLIHQLERCQRALAEGQKSIELNGQTVEDLEPKIIELKQQIRKSEAAKLKAQARLKVIKEGGMQIEEWSVVESEIRADMARAQEELESKRLREVTTRRSSSDPDMMGEDDKMDRAGRRDMNSDQKRNNNDSNKNKNGNNNTQVGANHAQVLLHISKDSQDGSEMMMDESMHNLASVSRSTSNLVDKQQKAISGYSALTDPSLVWQDDYSSAWNAAGASAAAPSVPIDIKPVGGTQVAVADSEHQQTGPGGAANNNRYNHLETSSGHPAGNNRAGQNQHSAANNTVQSSSPLSAIMDGNHGLSTSPYQAMGEAYKSDYECDYNRTSGPHMASAASSAEPYGVQHYGGQQSNADANQRAAIAERPPDQMGTDEQQQQHQEEDVSLMLGRLVIAQYAYDKTNEDDLSFAEGEILRVLEISDSNWLQARNESTGEHGFIPAPYVRLLPDGGQQEREESPAQQDQLRLQQQEAAEQNCNRNENHYNYESYVEDPNELEEDDQFGVSETQVDGGPVFCRALYDYQPEADTYEPDGLPHLALAQGELLRVLDQGEEDGWWLVEKNDGAKGHVPSMLVEELEEGAGDDGDGDDEGDVSERSCDYPDLGAPPPPLPNIEPPRPPAESAEEQSLEALPIEQSSTTAATTQAESTGADKPSSSLVATSFIIIEPTPEVESRSITESKSEKADQAGGEQQQQQQPPPSKGYSVVNENFVLEGPTRKPSQLDETNNNNHYEPLSECDDSDIPAPPSVVIESFEVERHDSSSSAGGGDGDDDQTPSSQDETAQAQPREIKHTGNVDVNPMLRLRAEEFTKQIIAEAIAMTPQITANRSRISEEYDEESRYDTYNGRDESAEDEEEENQ